MRVPTDAHARGSTQREQHLDQDPPRPRSPRVTVDRAAFNIFDRALRLLLRMRVLRALRRIARVVTLPPDSRILSDSARKIVENAPGGAAVCGSTCFRVRRRG